MIQPNKLLAALVVPVAAGLVPPDRKSALSREEGQSLAEYALILALIALLVVGAIYFLRTQITSLFSSIGNNI